jgi:hypothetical protein
MSAGRRMTGVDGVQVLRRRESMAIFVAPTN